MAIRIRRRELLAALGGAAAWPLVARAQQGERMRRIGVLMNFMEDDPETTARLDALAQGLQQFGWIVGRNVQIEHRSGASLRRLRWPYNRSPLGRRTEPFRTSSFADIR